VNAPAPGGPSRGRCRVRSASFLTKDTEKDRDQNVTHIYGPNFTCDSRQCRRLSHVKFYGSPTVQQNHHICCLTIYKLVMDEVRCGGTSQLVNGCAAHSSRRLLTRHLKICSLVTLFTS
jgi:hypothetical protein